MVPTVLSRWIIALVIATVVTVSVVFPASACDISYPATPQAVVAAFCQAYAQGNGLSSSSVSNVLKYTTWADTPGWDSAVVIRGYRIDSFKINGTVTEVTVIFDKVGILESGESHLLLTIVDKSEVKTFRVVKAGRQWKISKPLLPPHIEIDTAIRLLEGEISTMTVTEAKRAETEISALKRFRDHKN